MFKLVAVLATRNTHYAIHGQERCQRSLLECFSATCAGRPLDQPHRNTWTLSCMFMSVVSPSSRYNEDVNYLRKLAARAASVQCFSFLLDVEASCCLSLPEHSICPRMLPAQPPGMLQLSAARAGQLLAQPHRNTCTFSCMLKSGVGLSSRDNQKINCLSKLAAWAASPQCLSLLDVHWSWLLLQSSRILSMKSLVKNAINAASWNASAFRCMYRSAASSASLEYLESQLHVQVGCQSKFSEQPECQLPQQVGW